MGYQNYILHITNNAGMNSNAWPGKLYLMPATQSTRGFSPLKDTHHLTQQPALFFLFICCFFIKTHFNMMKKLIYAYGIV